MIIPSGTVQSVQRVNLNKVLTVLQVTDSPSTELVSLNKVLTASMSFKCYLHSRTGNVLVKLTSLNDYPLGDDPVSSTGQFKLNLDVSMSQIGH